MPELHLDDARLHYEVHGSDGPFVLFLHGALASGQAFRGQLPALRDKFRCVLVDQRGHGRSSHFGEETPWESLTHERLTNDALALLDLLTPHEPAHIVGVSMGGLVAGLLAHHHPERVDTLALLSTPGAPDPRRQAFFRDTPPEALPKGTQRLGALWHGPRYWPELTRHLFAYFADPPGAPQDIYAQQPRPSSGRALVMQSVDDELLDPHDYEKWAARIEAKTTVERPPGDHAFFADGRAGTKAANEALGVLLSA